MPERERSSAPSTQPKGIRSIEIGYRVLLAVQRGPVPVQLGEIARRAGLSSGATHNYLASLVRTGLVEQEGRGSYRLGPSAFALSLASFQQLSGYDVMRQTTKALFETTGSSVAAAVWSQAGPVSVFKLQPERTVLYEFRTGLLPLLSAAAPRVFIAYLPAETTLPLLEHELAQRGRNPADAAALRESYTADVREKGYAVTTYVGDIGDEVAALSAPVFGAEGKIEFALSLVDFARRVHPRVGDDFLGRLLAAAREASGLLAVSRG